MSHPVAIFGSSGYAGGELIRLIDGHPDLEITYLGAHSAAGRTSTPSIHISAAAIQCSTRTILRRRRT